MSKTTNIFDAVETNLDQRIFDGIEPRRSVIKFIKRVYYHALDRRLGVIGTEWADLYLTGSLTTYQYSPTSDADVSVFPNYNLIWTTLNIDPHEARKRLVDMSINYLDGTFLPGTQHPLQFFVVPPGISPGDMYQLGLRSGYDILHGGWLAPPERSRSHNVQMEMPDAFERAADIAEKLTLMLDAGDYDSAREVWHNVHAKRQLDQRAGLGDYSEGNIVYKWLLHEGLFDRIRSELNEYIAKTARWPWQQSKPFGEWTQQDEEWANRHSPDKTQEAITPGQNKIEALQEIINKSPWASHQTAADPASILQKGLLPNAEGQGIQGRLPGLVYLAPTGSRFWSGNAEFFVDLRKLDPNKVYWALPDDEIAYAGIIPPDALRRNPNQQQYSKTADVDHLWDDRITTKIIYDFDKDRIILGTQADLPKLHESNKIVGEYADGRATLFEADKQWINPSYFRRLWHVSYPERELKDVYFRRETGDEYKLKDMPRKRKKSGWKRISTKLPDQPWNDPAWLKQKQDQLDNLYGFYGDHIEIQNPYIPIIILEDGRSWVGYDAAAHSYDFMIEDAASELGVDGFDLEFGNLKNTQGSINFAGNEYQVNWPSHGLHRELEPQIVTQVLADVDEDRKAYWGKDVPAE